MLLGFMETMASLMQPCHVAGWKRLNWQGVSGVVSMGLTPVAGVEFRGGMDAAVVFGDWYTNDSRLEMKQRILVVDDEPSVLTLLAEFLERHGYSVATAASYAEGKQRVHEDPFHLVILDIAFPDGDGMELLDNIKEAHPNLPVIMLTGLGFDKDLMEEALTKKASGYISKTLPASQLLMEIHRVLKQYV
jgi:CheY-like chemotaxis protein